MNCPIIGIAADDQHSVAAGIDPHQVLTKFSLGDRGLKLSHQQHRRPNADEYWQKGRARSEAPDVARPHDVDERRSIAAKLGRRRRGERTEI